MTNTTNSPRRLWLIFAQATAVAAGLALGWRALAPSPAVPHHAEVVAVKESSQGAEMEAADGRSIGSFRAAARKASASVVNVYTRKAVARRYPDWRSPYGDSKRELTPRQESLGSGVIVAEQGYVLTNNHVIEGADEIAVMLPGGQVAEARVVGTDPESDLAVLKVAAKGLRPVTFADAKSVQVGDIVLAVGDPFGVGQTVTQGIVSATGRNRLGINTFENFIQTDAAINPGNSGGALVDTAGHLVGINTAILSESGGSQGVGFAIPVSLARSVTEQIIASGHVSRGWLGVSTRDAIDQSGAEETGAVLVDLLKSGPADKAGLRPGDVVVAVNDKAIRDSFDLMNETTILSPGSRAEVKVLRGGRRLTVSTVLGQRPAVRRS